MNYVNAITLPFHLVSSLISTRAGAHTTHQTTQYHGDVVEGPFLRPGQSAANAIIGTTALMRVWDASVSSREQSFTCESLRKRKLSALALYHTELAIESLSQCYAQ